MPGRSAILFVIDDTQKTGLPHPLMLQQVMGAPLLKWLSAALRDSQVGRFFLVCREEYLEQAKACIPDGAELVTAQDENPSDLLHVFLSTADEAEEDLLIVAGPVIYAPYFASTDPGRAPRLANACMASRKELMQALDGDFSFGSFLKEHTDACTDREGFFSVGSVAELADWQPRLNRQLLLELAQQGVEIWDYNNCYVEPGVEIGIGTVLMPGVILQGKCTVGYGCVIGPYTQLTNVQVGNHTRIDSSHLEDCAVGSNAQIGPYAHLREGTQVSAGAKVGAFVELKQTQVGEGSQIPHLAYLGDATVGSEVNVGCGVVTANFDRRDKSATQIGDRAFVGCNTVLVAPVSVGKGAYVAAGSTITEDVPAQALGIARAHQSNRKEWALKNK